MRLMNVDVGKKHTCFDFVMWFKSKLLMLDIYVVVVVLSLLCIFESFTLCDEDEYSFEDCFVAVLLLSFESEESPKKLRNDSVFFLICV